MSTAVSLNLLQEAAARQEAVRVVIFDTVSSRPESPITVEKISVRHLNFNYEDGNQALRDVTVPIHDKCVTAFMGSSGCGKSTLLRVFNRMHDLYPGQRAEGAVLLDGVDILGSIDVCQLRTRIGMVFQKPTPFPMTVYENIAFGIRLQSEVGKAEMDELVEGALRRAALWDEVKDDLDRYGLQARSCNRHRHAQSAAGRSGVGLCGVHVPGRIA
jgi:phosphate transport system ATP-binding protein